MNARPAIGATFAAAALLAATAANHASAQPAPTPTAAPTTYQPPAGPFGPGSPAAPASGLPAGSAAPAPSTPPSAAPPPGTYPPSGWPAHGAGAPPPGGQGPQGYPSGYQGAPGYPPGPGGYPPSQGYPQVGPDGRPLPGYAEEWQWHPGCPEGCGPCREFPGKVPYHEGQPIPPGYELDSEPLWGLVIAGLVTTGTLWLFSAVAGIGLEDEEGHSEQSSPYSTRPAEHYWPLALPIVGPFVTLGTGEPEGPAISIMVLDGILQTGGLVMIIAGAAVKRDVLVWRGTNMSVQAAPIVMQGGAGVGATATF